MRITEPRAPGTLPESIQTVPDVIRWWAERTPEAPALLSLGAPTMTYAALHGQIQIARCRMREFGVRRGDRVAALLDDDLAGAVTLLTLMSVTVAAPLSLSLTPIELARDLRRLDARALVAAPDRAAHVDAIASDLGLLLIPHQFLYDPPPPSAPSKAGAFEADVAAPDDAMLIAHTSGTTDLPKRVPITHHMQRAAATARNRLRGFTRADCCLLLAPGSSVMFVTNCLAMLVAGGSVIRVPRLDPLAALQANATLRPTWILATPPVYHTMLRHVSSRSELFRNPRLRLVNWAGAGADADLVRRLECAFGVPCDSHYGMSEASAIAAPGPPGAAPPGSVGVAAAGEIRIVGAGGEPLTAGEIGEVTVRGPHVFAGYLDDPAATADAFDAAGWFRTGDLGYLDERGNLFLTGRRKDLINRGGTKISPVEVERVLQAHPAVAQATAFAVPDAQWGEDVVAAVVVQPGTAVTPRRLRSWLLDHLSPAKTPYRIWFVDALPRTETGKVQRGELTRLWQEAHG